MADSASPVSQPAPPAPHLVQRTIQKRKYACDQCNKIFDLKNFTRHKRIHTGERPYVCDYPGCSKSFGQMAHLTTHKLTHTGDEPFVCDFPGCEVRFSRRGNLATHKRIHTGDKPYVCDYEGCGARFTQTSYMATHKRVHTGEKPFKCDFPGCDTCFTISSNLTKHKHSLHTARGQQRQKIKRNAWLASSRIPASPSSAR